jgi:hypothetical protein
VGHPSKRGLSRGTTAALAVLAISLTALLTTAAAEAKPGYQVTPPDFELFFFANATNGYSVHVAGERPGRVMVSVSRNFETATYELPGRVTDSRIEANLGALGRISVGFHPRVTEGGGRFDNGRCRGRKALNEKGRFVGSFEFHGELDFADISATRFEGNRYRSFRVVCSRHTRVRASAAPFPGEAAGRVVAVAHVPGASTYFSALTRVPDIKPGPTWEFSAARIEDFSRIRVIREVRSASYVGVTASDPGVQPVTATVEAPAPFSGLAAFSQTPDQLAAWSGSLAVELPGAGAVPLTGPAFAAAFCRGSGELAQRPCTDLLAG